MKRLALLIGTLICIPVMGDVVHLKDGAIVEGEVHRTNDGYAVLQSDGKYTTVPADQVQSIELKKNDRSLPESPEQQLASIRRSVGNLSDIRQIIDRYKAFIAQNKDAPAGKEAEKDLALWRDRQDKGYVKVADKWVTKEEQAVLEQKSLETARVVQQMIKEGRLKEAAPLLDKALTDDPHNASALYLKGVLMYRSDQLVPARKAFEAVAALLPDHGPTQNNLAVIIWKQRTPVGALTHYDKAMTASPANRTVLDNVAEALNSLTPEHRNSPVTKKVVAHFKDQDADLQQKMQEKGLFRWGSSWVTEAQLAKLQEAEKAVKDKVDALQTQLDEIKTRIIRIDRDIQDDQQLVDTLFNQSFIQDPQTGRVFQNPLPNRYYSLISDIKSLKAEKAAKLREGLHVQDMMKREQQKVPTPRYSGVQKLIDAEGMPDKFPPPPTTQPAPAPAS